MTTTAPTNGHAANGHTHANTKHALIVGGGLAGLAAAAELATHGLRVTLVEQNTHLGGKMNVLHAHSPHGDRYTFDMGPTIITMPQVLRGIVERAAHRLPGLRVTDLIDLIDLDPQWRCFYEDGTVINLRRNADTFAAQLDQQFPGQRAGAGYRRFVDWSRRMFGLSEQVFFYRDLGGIADMMRSTPPDPKLLADVLGMRLHSTVAGTIHKMVAEPHLRQLCEHFLQYVGSSPFLAPAILGLIASAQVDNGCWYAMPPAGDTGPGGTRLVARTVRTVAERLGVTFITGHRVRQITTQNGRATGVTLDDGSTIPADLVVSNCDVQRTHTDLLGTPDARSEQRVIASRYTPACSGVVLYLGLDRQYEHLAHHNFLFSRDSHDEFNDIYHRGVPARDPTLYIAAPSRTDPTQAPAGHEALYILIHTAYKRPNQHWEARHPDGSAPLLDQYRPVIIDKLKRMGMPDIEQHIRVEHHLTPDSIERLYNCEGGAIYGLASHGKLHGGFKPRNRSKLLKGLYLAGGSANPGPGVPMVLMSGVTAARAAAHDLGLPLIGTPTAREPRDSLVEPRAPRQPALA